MSYKINVLLPADKDVANGVAGLDGAGHINLTSLPVTAVRKTISGRFVPTDTNITVGELAKILLPKNIRITPLEILMGFDSIPSGTFTSGLELDILLNGASILSAPYSSTSYINSYSFTSFGAITYDTTNVVSPPNFIVVNVTTCDFSVPPKGLTLSFIFDIEYL